MRAPLKSLQEAKDMLANLLEINNPPRWVVNLYFQYVPGSGAYCYEQKFEEETISLSWLNSNSKEKYESFLAENDRAEKNKKRDLILGSMSAAIQSCFHDAR